MSASKIMARKVTQYIFVVQKYISQGIVIFLCLCSVIDSQCCRESFIGKSGGMRCTLDGLYKVFRERDFLFLCLRL